MNEDPGSAQEVEFSRPIALARIGPGRVRETIEADPAERAALCRRFGLLALDRLTAEVELSRQGHSRPGRSRQAPLDRGADIVLLRASFAAAFVQSCVVTLEPVPGEISADFALRYGPPDAETPDEIAALLPEGAEEPAGEPAAETFEPLAGETIDIGEAVAQEFSLALPAFPRCPDAALDGDSGAENGRF
jgi:uncharacterized metal-binding protein YceD (DUF177 family)